MINVFLLFLLACVTVPKAEAKYKSGQCFYLIDHKTGKGDTRDVLQVVYVTKQGYHYKWWVLNQQWAAEANYRTYQKFEKMVKSIQCPKG